MLVISEIDESFSNESRLIYEREKTSKVTSTNNFVFRPFLASREEFFKGAILFENNLAIAFRDGFPVAEGHLLVIPKRHIESWFELKSDERESCHELILNGKKAIKNDDSSVSGFNLGVNDGLSAGQTIFHAHLHLIPRRQGDVENPRGGVRHVIPGKGYY